MKKPLITIIVPVYRVELYLPKCLDSIINQTYTHFEAIIVDDGSPDMSGRICDEYAKKDSRLLVVHKTNGGVSSARNAALEIASGDYVCFVDSDDWLEPEYLDNFASILINKDAFVLQGIIYDYENKSSRFDLEPKQIMTATDLIGFCYYSKGLNNGYLVQRVFNNEVIRNNRIRFDETLTFAEDAEFIFRYLPFVNHFHIQNNAAYHYCIRGTGLTALGNVAKFEQLKTAYSSILHSVSILDKGVDNRCLKAKDDFVWSLLESWFVLRFLVKASEYSKCKQYLKESISLYHIICPNNMIDKLLFRLLLVREGRFNLWGIKITCIAKRIYKKMRSVRYKCS